MELLKQRRWAAISIFVGLLSLTGCGDKTLEDHQREELERTLAELRQVEGRYTGLVRSRSDKSVTGALALDIRVETRSNVPTNGGGRAGGRAALITAVEYVDFQKISISSDDSYFDVRSKQFQTNISIARSSGGSEDLSIGGKLEGERLKGSIGVTGFGAFGGEFELVRGGQDPENLIVGKLPQDDESNEGLVYSKTFKGQTRFKNNRITPAQVVVTQQSLSAGEDFMNKFVPVKSVNFTLNFGNGLSMVHAGSRWDQRTGILTGQWMSSTPGGAEAPRVSSECRSSGQGADLRWSCTHISSMLGQVATTIAVDPRDRREFTEDSFSERGSPIRAGFAGRALYDRGGSKQTQASLVVTLPPDTRGTQILEEFFPVREKAVFATLQLFANTSSDITVSFPATSTAWDRETGLLNGTTEIVGGSERTILSLECQGFFLDRTSQSFRCEYLSSRLFYPFVIDFRPL